MYVCTCVCLCACAYIRVHVSARVGFFSGAGVEVERDIPGERYLIQDASRQRGGEVSKFLNFKGMSFMYEPWKDR